MLLTEVLAQITADVRRRPAAAGVPGATRAMA